MVGSSDTAGVARDIVLAVALVVESAVGRTMSCSPCDCGSVRRCTEVGYDSRTVIGDESRERDDFANHFVRRESLCTMRGHSVDLC